MVTNFFNSSIFSLSDEVMLHLAAEVNTPLMRISASNQPVWKTEISRPHVNEEFFSILKSNSSYFEVVAGNLSFSEKLVEKLLGIKKCRKTNLLSLGLDNPLLVDGPGTVVQSKILNT